MAALTSVLVLTAGAGSGKESRSLNRGHLSLQEEISRAGLHSP